MATIERREGKTGVKCRVRVRLQGETSRTRTLKRKAHLLRRFDAVARPESDVSIDDRRDDAVAVPLHFVKPCIVGARCSDDLREPWREGSLLQRFPLWIEPVS